MPLVETVHYLMLPVVTLRFGGIQYFAYFLCNPSQTVFSGCAIK